MGISGPKLRCTEWSRVSTHGLGADARRQIDLIANAWRIANGLSVAPVYFSGYNGEQLCTRQFVGVIEIDGVTIEIFPKLDRLHDTHLSSETATCSVMSNLMWMLEVAEHRDVAETSTAHLQEEPTSFIDLFAYLLGKNLLHELERGVAHCYIDMEDDLPRVRGRVLMLQQATRNRNRYDRISCQWNEFSPDSSLNRVLKSACRYLHDRVKYRESMRFLGDCRSLLADVEDIPPTTALQLSREVRFSRPTDRFRNSFELACRLLSGVGHNLGIGDANTFVFLIDMNALFEAYVHSVLESHFNMAVEAQVAIGSLLQLETGAIRQVVDYIWGLPSCLWIGDAKYKHIAIQNGSLKFRDLPDGAGSNGPDVLAGNVLSAADVRQLTVYAELAKMKGASPSPRLALLYPFVGEPSQANADKATAWNGSEFWLVPVLVKRQANVGNAIRFLPESAEGKL